jgi:hypothetical protein
VIRYDQRLNGWISGKNPDFQGMPTINLEGDTNVCSCKDCFEAIISGLGFNYGEMVKNLPL